MKIGYVGLGKMGRNMVFRLMEKGHQVVAWNRSPEPREEVARNGAEVTESLEDLVSQLESPRLVWLMLPAGEPTDTAIDILKQTLEPGDTIVNGANELYTQAMLQGKDLEAQAIHYLDVGVSGGPNGARNGACLMIGGKEEIFKRYQQLFADIAAPNSYQFFPGYGAGHFVKMIHNGIEYGMMQAIAEGFDILKQASYEFDLTEVARIYNTGSVIESRLIAWMRSGFEQFGPELSGVSGSAGSGGNAGLTKSEAQWTIDVARDLGIKTPVIQSSVEVRAESQAQPSYQGKVINTLRNQFGGHQTTSKSSS